MILNAYYPKPLFPPVSISDGCELMCKHCMGIYLKGMEKIENPENLVAYCKKLEKQGGNGILVSGGCDKEGKIIRLNEMINALKKIKEETNLIIAIHPGYVDTDLANHLSNACDIAFVDIIGNEDTARHVTGLKKMMGIETLKNLIEVGIPTTPHLTIGLCYGNILGEHDALKILKDFPIKKIVLNVICRTKGTSFEKIRIPSLQQIKEIMEEAMELEISLGCMRPRGLDIEKMAMEIGIKDIAVPSKKILAYAEEKGYEIRKIPACCGLTKEIMGRMSKLFI